MKISETGSEKSSERKFETTGDFLSFLTNEIHTVVASTVDDDSLPVTCAIDMMDSDENSLYFLTARGKGFYHRLKRQKFIALTGIKGKDTMSSVAVSVCGHVEEERDIVLSHLLEKNPYMLEIDAMEISDSCTGCGLCLAACPQQCIDSSTVPFCIRNENCLMCGRCIEICPQKAVSRRRSYDS